MTDILDRQSVDSTVLMPSRASENYLERPSEPERFNTIVIGGGQAGLAVGYYLAKHDVDFVILDANRCTGDSWRQRWDTLRTFTPARYDSLPGMPFPAPSHSFPTKDQVADYLENYAATFQLPVRHDLHVDRLSSLGDRFLVAAGDRRFEAAQVVVATGPYHAPRIPDFAADLDPSIRQLHSSEFTELSQLQEGAVLVVGASNSGAEIAYNVAREHKTWLSGRDTGQMPFHIDGRFAQMIDYVIWFAVNHMVKIQTPLGRKARSVMLEHGGPLERIRRDDLAAAGVERVFARTVGVRDGKPLLADGQVLDVANVIWSTGFQPDYSWIDLPVIGEDGWPLHERGVVPAVPDLYFVGLPFLYAGSSSLIGGVGRDARYVAEAVAARSRAAKPAVPPARRG